MSKAFEKLLRWEKTKFKQQQKVDKIQRKLDREHADNVADRNEKLMTMMGSVLPSLLSSIMPQTSSLLSSMYPQEKDAADGPKVRLSKEQANAIWDAIPPESRDYVQDVLVKAGVGVVVTSEPDSARPIISVPVNAADAFMRSLPAEHVGKVGAVLMDYGIHFVGEVPSIDADFEALDAFLNSVPAKFRTHVARALAEAGVSFVKDVVKTESSGISPNSHTATPS